MSPQSEGFLPVNNVLLKQSDQYEGQYVALDSVSNGSVFAHGEDMLQVHKEAKGKGLEYPIVFFIPRKDCFFVY
jgi:hypothetical protein